MTKPVEIPSDRKGMTLQTARKIAKKVGASIRQATADNREDAARMSPYEVKLAIPGSPLIYADTPLEAAHNAVIGTAQAAHELITTAKKIYVEENLLFEG